MSGRGRSARRSMANTTASAVRGRRSGQTLGSQSREALTAAHGQRAAGEHVAAAPQFLALALVARQRSLPRVAARLYVEAGRAFVAGGDPDQGVAAAREALVDAALDADRKSAARHIGDLLTDLRAVEHGEAEALDTEACAALGVSSITTTAQEGAPTVNRAMRRRLPRICQTCGVSVTADTAAFHAEGGADCALCGSVLAG